MTILPAVPTQEADGLYFIEVDHLETPRLIADGQGRTVWRWENEDPFGDNPPEEDPDGDGRRFRFNLRFPGQYFDGETGLHYNFFRDYDPGIGRYTTSDPIGLGGGVNTYGYVGGNPIIYIDPLGLDVLVCYYPDGIGHVGFGNGNPGSDGSTSGYYPKRHLPFDNGEIRPDPDEKNKECVKLPANNEQDNCMEKCKSKRQQNPGRYNIYRNQCTSYVRTCLQECGLPHGSSTGPLPEPWYRGLPGTNPYPLKPHPVEP